MSVDLVLLALWTFHMVQIDMEDVQAGPGVLLERGGDQLDK